MPGPSEWIIIGIVAIVVLFGAKKLPEIARSLGRSQSEFKKGIKEGQLNADGTPKAEAEVEAKSQAEAKPEAKSDTAE